MKNSVWIVAFLLAIAPAFALSVQTWTDFAGCSLTSEVGDNPVAGTLGSGSGTIYYSSADIPSGLDCSLDLSANVPANGADGTNAFVEWSSGTSIGADGTDYTIAVWVLFNSTASYNGLFSTYDAGSAEPARFISGGYDGTYTAFEQDASSNYAFVDQGLTTNEWHLVVVTRDASANNLSLYVDGTYIESADDSALAGVDNSNILSLGYTAASAYAMQGAVAQFITLADSLNQNQITCLYNSGSGRQYVDAMNSCFAPELVLHYEFENNHDSVGTRTDSIALPFESSSFVDGIVGDYASRGPTLNNSLDSPIYVDYSQGVSVAGWLYYDGVVGGDGALIVLEDSVNGDYLAFTVPPQQLSPQDADYISLEMSANNFAEERYYHVSSASLTNLVGWHHYAVTYDPATDNIVFYFDGSELTGTVDLNTSTTPFTSPQSFDYVATGTWPSNYGGSGNGVGKQFDDVRFYSGVLSAQNVADLVALRTYWARPDVYLSLDDADLVANSSFYLDRANGHDALVFTVSGGSSLTTGIPGVVNEAVYFFADGFASGNNSLLITDWAPDIDANGLSFCANVNASNAPNSKAVFDILDTSTDADVQLSMDENLAYFQVCSNNNCDDYFYIQVDTSSYLVADEYNQLCVVYNGGVYDNLSDTQFYINTQLVDYGVDLVDSDFVGDPVTNFNWSAVDISIGAIYDYAGGLGDSFLGGMDEVYFYEGVLDASGISSLYELTNTNQSQMYAEKSLTDSLRTYLPLTDSTTGLAVDEMGNYNFTGSAEPCVDNSCYQFVTASTGNEVDYRYLENENFKFDAPFSMSFNVIRDKNELIVIAGDYSGSDSGFTFSFGEVCVYENAWSDYSCSYYTDADLNEWHHYVVTVDGLYNIKLYKDGVLSSVDSTDVMGVLTNISSDFAFGFGRNASSSTPYTYFNMSKFAFWDRTLSLGEAAELYSLDGAVPMPSPPVVPQFPVSGVTIANADTGRLSQGWHAYVSYTGGGGADLYQWYVNDTLISGATSNTLEWYGGNYPEYAYVTGDTVTVQITAGNGTDYDAPVNYSDIVVANPVPVVSIGWDGNTYSKSSSQFWMNASDAHSCKLYIDSNLLEARYWYSLTDDGTFDWYVIMGGELGLPSYPDLNNAYDDGYHNLSVSCFDDNRNSAFSSNGYEYSGAVLLEAPVVPPTITFAEIQSVPLISDNPLYYGYNANVYYTLDLAETDASTFRWFVNDVENFNTYQWVMPGDSLVRTEFVEGDNVTVEITPATVESGAGTPVNYSAIVQAPFTPTVVGNWDGQIYNESTIDLEINWSNSFTCRAYVDGNMFINFQDSNVFSPGIGTGFVSTLNLVNQFGGDPTEFTNWYLTAGYYDDSEHNITIRCFDSQAAVNEDRYAEYSGTVFLGEPASLSIENGVCAPTTYPNELDLPSVATMQYNFTVVSDPSFVDESYSISLFGAPSCSYVAVNATTRNYACSFPVHFYQPFGDYDVQVNYSSNSLTAQLNDSAACTVGQLLAIQRQTSSISFPNAGPGISNVESSSPVVVRNAGNTPVDLLLTAYNLQGISNPAVSLGASSFKAGGSLGSAVTLEHGVAKDISVSVPVGASSTSNIRFWLSMASNQVVQDYRSTTPWQVTGQS